MNTRLKLITTSSFAAILTLCSLSTSHAALLASDDFSSYAPGTNLSGQNGGTGVGGTGFSGGYLVGAPGQGFLNEVRNATPLSYPNYPAVGGNYANLASGFGGPAFNFFQRTVDVAGAFSAYNDGTRVGLDGTTLWGSFAYFEVNNAQFYLQGAANQIFALPTTGSNSLFVFRINFGAGNADTFSLFNNPDLSTFDGTGPATSTFNGDFSFQTIVFVAPNSTNEVRIDNIRLGNFVSDVTPVPEPSTYAFLGLAGVAALIYRKKRNRLSA